MRIIAGTLKGRRLAPPTWPGLRPTSDRLRETLFAILGPLDGLRLLDVCAGTGALGLEALSRGAACVTCIDVDRRACRLIAANAAHCGVSDRCVTICASAPNAVRFGPGTSFDVVLLDPPYDAPHPGALVAWAASLTAVTGRLVLEHAWRVAPPAVTQAAAVRTVRAGDSALTFYRVERPDADAALDPA